MVLFETGIETDVQLQMPERLIGMILVMWSALMLALLGDGRLSGHGCAA
jgi:hypothetical protein